MPQWEFKNWPPDKQWYKDNKARDVIIYCGSEDLSTKDGLVWTHEEGGQFIQDQGRKVGEKWTLCHEDEDAATLENPEGLFDILLLCHMIDEDYEGEPDIVERGTYRQLNDRPTIRGQEHPLGYGMYFDFRMARILSLTLLHEMLHIARPDYSQYCPC
jgi:hypothetical protein